MLGNFLSSDRKGEDSDPPSPMFDDAHARLDRGLIARVTRRIAMLFWFSRPMANGL